MEGSTTKAVFHTYVAQVTSLAPFRIGGDRCLSAPKGKRTAKTRKAKLLYLPPYSLDFHPIEEAFHKLKALARGCIS